MLFILLNRLFQLGYWELFQFYPFFLWHSHITVGFSKVFPYFYALKDVPDSAYIFLTLVLESHISPRKCFYWKNVLETRASI